MAVIVMDGLRGWSSTAPSSLEFSRVRLPELMRRNQTANLPVAGQWDGVLPFNSWREILESFL